jgi:hypothetical protein
LQPSNFLLDGRVGKVLVIRVTLAPPFAAHGVLSLLPFRSFGAIRDGRNDSSDRMVASTLDLTCLHHHRR